MKNPQCVGDLSTLRTVIQVLQASDTSLRNVHTCLTLQEYNAVEKLVSSLTVYELLLLERIARDAVIAYVNAISSSTGIGLQSTDQTTTGTNDGDDDDEIPGYNDYEYGWSW